MECNVGEKDKKLRIYGGIALLLTSVTFKSPLLAIVSVVLIIGGFTRKCMLYKMLKIDTTKPKNSTPPEEI